MKKYHIENSIESEGENTLFPTTEDGLVILPFNEDGFKDFLNNLLGKPQTISRTISGSFVIEIKDIENLYHLILQRVTQQNKGQILQFSAKIIFSDHSSVELNSIEDLVTYNEVRPIISRDVHLTWTFLVRFQDKEIPEKQRIQVSFITRILERRSRMARVSTFWLDEDIDDIVSLYFRRGELKDFVNYRIEHTARTWGADIEALLTNYVESLIETPTGIRGFIRRHDFLTGLFVALVFLISVVVGSYISFQVYWLEKVSDFHNLSQHYASSSIDLLSAQVEFIGNFILDDGNVWSPTAVLVLGVVSSIVAIFILAGVGTICERYMPSFVLLTQEAYKYRNKYLQKTHHNWTRDLLFALFLSILAGVVANFIFRLLII